MMAFRVLLTEPKYGYAEELSLPSFVVGDLINYLPPRPSCQREEICLPKKSEGPVGPEELLEGELIPEFLGPQVNGPHQESPAVRSQLARSNVEVDQQVQSVGIQRQTKARHQRILIEGYELGLMAVGLLRWNQQRKTLG